MKFALKTLNQKVTLAFCACALAPLPASALLINTSPVGFSNFAKASDSEGGGAGSIYARS